MIGNNVPGFIDLTCGVRFLNFKLHCPSMYPRGADITGTNLLRCMYGIVHFDEKIVRNEMKIFVDADDARSVYDCRSISYIFFTFLGFTVNCKVVK